MHLYFVYKEHQGCRRISVSTRMLIIETAVYEFLNKCHIFVNIPHMLLGGSYVVCFVCKKTNLMCIHSHRVILLQSHRVVYAYIVHCSHPEDRVLLKTKYSVLCVERYQTPYPSIIDSTNSKGSIHSNCRQLHSCKEEEKKHFQS